MRNVEAMGLAHGFPFRLVAGWLCMIAVELKWSNGIHGCWGAGARGGS